MTRAAATEPISPGGRLHCAKEGYTHRHVGRSRPNHVARRRRPCAVPRSAESIRTGLTIGRHGPDSAGRYGIPVMGAAVPPTVLSLAMQFFHIWQYLRITSVCGSTTLHIVLRHWACIVAVRRDVLLWDWCHLKAASAKALLPEGKHPKDRAEL